MKKLSAIAIMIFCVALVANAQPFGGKLKTSQKLKVADEQYDIGDYYNALDWYMKVLESSPDDVSVMAKVADVHFKLRDLNAAQEWFAKVLAKDKDGAYSDANFHYGRILKMNGALDDAETALEAFMSSSSDATMKQLAQVELSGIDMARSMQADGDITVSDAGDNVNSPYTDFSPVYGADGEMYYGAMVSEDVVVLDGSRTDYFARIYTADKSGGAWGDGTALDANINRPGVHTGNVALSPDGNTMYFTRSEFSSNRMTASSLYRSEKGAEGWGPAYSVDGLGDYIVKHPAVGEAYGSAALFFVSDMAGGQGGYDIYYAAIEGDKLGSPVNLGDAINTVGDELTPSYNDGTLYFSSTGHPGIGGLDVFASDWTGSWSAPENVGKSINSSYDDIYFSLDASKLNGFVVSNRPSNRSLKSTTCCDDIYDVNIKEVILDLAALTFSNKNGAKLDGVSVQLVEMTDGVEGITETSKGAGHKFGFPLARETAYKIIATKAGYENAVVQFNTVGLDETQTIEKKLTLKFIEIEPEIVIEEVAVYDTIRTEKPIVLRNILYDYDKSFIRTDAEPDLEMLYGYLRSYPEMIIELGSHTDSKGRDGYNESLSQRRAEAARQWLVAKGIRPDRIVAVGYGESKPVAPNNFEDGSDNPDGRQLNRRTEFRILKGPKYIVTSRIEKRLIKRQRTK